MIRQRQSHPWRRFGYPVLIRRDFNDLLLRVLLSFCFVWEDISKSRYNVSSAFQTLRISSNILRCASVVNSLLGDWISRLNTISRVWYITSRKHRGQACGSRRRRLTRGKKKLASEGSRRTRKKRIQKGARPRPARFARRILFYWGRHEPVRVETVN